MLIAIGKNIVFGVGFDCQFRNPTQIDCIEIRETDYLPGVVSIELVSCSVTHDLPHVQLRRVDATRRRSEHVPEGALLRVQYLTLWLVSLLVHPGISKLIIKSLERSTIQ